MPTAIIITATVSLIIFINALFVGAEFSAIRARKTRLQQLAGSGNQLAQILAPIKADPKALDNYIAACQLGITATSLVLGAYAQNTVAQILVQPLVALGNIAAPLAHSISATILLALFTILQIVIGELLPKSITIQYPEQMALATTLPVRWSQIVLRPFIWFFNGSGEVVLRLFKFDSHDGKMHLHSPSEIELLVSDSYEGGLIDTKEQQMLRNAFRLRKLTARQIMVPRTRLVTASSGASILNVLNKAINAGVTRIPIYKKDIDNIVGFVHIKDLFSLHQKKEDDLAKVLRKVIFVPETLPVFDVWRTLNHHRQYMAVVFDEYGGTAGLITFEDLIEEIFGEVEDEFDQDIIELYSYDSEGRTHLRGDLLITDINEYLKLSLPEGENDTLGGLVFSQLGRPPEEGDEVQIDNLAIRVEKVADQGILELSLKLPTDTPPEIGEWEMMPRE